ncbi:MAG: hypothetical protein LUH43_07375 [Clostridia bacterium]|nr:hypothetical protein [Clostridia bacterium]
MNEKGRFGIHGGQYIPETLMNAVNELKDRDKIQRAVASVRKNNIL